MEHGIEDDFWIHWALLRDLDESGAFEDEKDVVLEVVDSFHDSSPVDTSHEWVPVTFINAIVIGDMEGIDSVCEQVDRLRECFGAAIQVVDVKADSDFFR